MERTIKQNREEVEQAPLTLGIPFEHDSQPIVSPLSPESALAIHNELIGEPASPEMLRPRLGSPARFSRGSSLPRHRPSSSDLAASGWESIPGRTKRYSTRSASTNQSPPRSAIGRPSHFRGRGDRSTYEGSVDSRTLEKSSRGEDSDIQEKRTNERSSQSSSNDFRHSNVMEAITSATQELRQVRLEEQTPRPVRYEAQSKLHKPDPDILRIFEASAKEEVQIRRPSIGDWLRISTWWLLKARVTLANCSRHYHVSARGSSSLSSDSRTTSQQAYIDLLKASYILYGIVLEDESNSTLSTDENRKLIADLSEVCKQPVPVSNPKY